MTDRLAALEEEARQKGKRLADEFAVKVDGIKNRIGELQRQKIAIEKGRISREEAVANLKADLEAGRREWIMRNFVEPTIRTYQSQVRSLQNLDHLRIHEFGGGQGIMRFIYSWISPSMIDEAAAVLDQAPDQKQRAKAIADLDKKIEEAERELEALLK